MEEYHVRIANDELVFSAGHFVALKEGVCEALHGHDYRVAAEVHGPLDENHYVVDFAVLQETLKAIVDELDHRVLLPSEHPQLQLAVDEKEVKVTFGERRWVLPRGDCLLLPMPNTTTELLARRIGQRLLEELEARLKMRPVLVRIEIAESHGVSAVCELRGR